MLGCSGLWSLLEDESSRLRAGWPVICPGCHSGIASGSAVGKAEAEAEAEAIGGFGSARVAVVRFWEYAGV